MEDQEINEATDNSSAYLDNEDVDVKMKETADDPKLCVGETDENDHIHRLSNNFILPMVTDILKV